MEREGSDFLNQKYDLHTTPEVESASNRTEVRAKLKNKKFTKDEHSGPLLREKIPQNPKDRIENYLDRFKEIIERVDPEKRKKGILALKHFLRNQFVIKSQEVPEAVFLLEQRIAREQGHGYIGITSEFRKRKTDEIISNQTQSLDRWINYLSSLDAQYPDWAKYWAFRSMTEMGKLEKKEEQGKETARFQKRTADTVASFPPLNERALAMTIGVMTSRLKEKAKPKKDRQPVESKSIKLDDKEFDDLLSTENFSKIYTQFLIEMPEYSTEGLREIRGKWIKYEQGSDPTPLVKSLEGYPLEWCTANFDTAQTQLQGGDFHVYYSLNQIGEPKIPRVAIRMESRDEYTNIAEVRGIAPGQNTDPYIIPVIEEKMKEFPDGNYYKKKAEDMRLLTSIEKKNKTGQILTKDEILFLYEINGPIEGFGQEDEKDPRIDEVRFSRNKKEDLAVIFDCSPEDVAEKREDITTGTKVYIGQTNPLFPEIFSRNIQHIYNSFPEDPENKFELKKLSVEIGGKTREQYQKELETAMGDDRNDFEKAMVTKMINSSDFMVLDKKEKIDLVAVNLYDLGFDDHTDIVDILNKSKQLGLELCPPEIGPSLYLSHRDQSNNYDNPDFISDGYDTDFISDGYDTDFYIMMEPIAIDAEYIKSAAFQIHSFQKHSGYINRCTLLSDNAKPHYMGGTPAKRTFNIFAYFIFRIPNNNV